LASIDRFARPVLCGVGPTFGLGHHPLALRRCSGVLLRGLTDQPLALECHHPPRLGDLAVSTRAGLLCLAGSGGPNGGCFLISTQS
jgi:hypothetical protein